MTQKQGIAKRKFYQLSNAEWIEVGKKLSHSELLVLYHLRTFEPFGDRVTELTTKEVAESLSISQRTVQRAIVKLHDLELIDLEIRSFAFKVRSQHQDATPMTDGDTHVASTSPMSRQRHPCRVNVTHVASTSPMSKTKAENLIDQEFQIPHTIKTYKTYTDSLSETEKESFLEFGKKKAAELPNPPTLISQWIKTHWEDLRSQWEKSQGKVSASQSNKWNNHPQREEWLEKIRQLGPAGFQAEDMPNQKIRREFYVWADANNLIWGNEA